MQGRTGGPVQPAERWGRGEAFARTLALPDVDDPRLQHLTRVAAARGRSPGWRAQPPDAAPRLFTDSEHGSPGASLDAALAWRDGHATLAPVPVPDASVTLAPGIYYTAQPGNGTRYPVVRAVADGADGRRHTLVRSLLKHSPERAIRQAADLRFTHRGPTALHPSADALFDDAVQAFHDAVAEHS